MDQEQKNKEELQPMTTVKLNSTGSQVTRLCELLGVKSREKFDSYLQSIVKKFQTAQGLGVDGICGSQTWLALFKLQRLKLNSLEEIEAEDYEWASEYLGCEKEALMALVQVETGGKGGFDSDGKPQILFESHIFYKELKNAGIDPEPLTIKYPGLVTKSQTSSNYEGGSKEWIKFDMASVLSSKASKLSISMGLFQILGQNYKSCWCSSVEEFYEGMCKNQFQQFIYGISFLRSSGIYSHLGKRNCSEVARLYNGVSAIDTYSKKLEEAYNSLKK